MKVLKNDELIYNTGGMNGQLNGECLDLDGPTSADAPTSAALVFPALTQSCTA